MQGPEGDKQEKGENHHQKKHHQHKKHKHEKHQRPAEFDRNPDLINEDTELPPLPKKNQYLPKPEIKDFRDKEKKNKDRIDQLINQKKQIKSEKFKPPKNTSKGEKEEENHDQFKEEVEDFKELKDRLMEVKMKRNNKRDKLKALIDEAKQNNAVLKELKGMIKGSRENILERLEKMQHRLITDELSKEEEKQLNSEIMVLKRKVGEAQSSGNMEVKFAKAEQRKEELDEEIQMVKEDKEPLEVQFKELQEQLDKKKQVIEKLKGSIKEETNLKAELKDRNEKEWEEWKDKKKKRLDELTQKIKKIEDQNDKIWDEYNEKKDAYWEQKHKFDFIEWQHKVRNRKVNEKEREKRKQLMAEKEKEREKQEQKKKYINEIQLCNFLINYLKNLQIQFSTHNNQKQEEVQQVAQNINEKMASDAQWKKEKGLEVLQSKKSKEDDEVPAKKGKKHKKRKEQKKQEKKFQIPFNVQVMFENLKLLSPESLQEIDKKVEELKEREALFDRACKEESTENDEKLITEIKGSKKDGKKENRNKKEEEFPVLA